MVSMSIVSVTTWIVWIVIGIIAGYMTGRLINDGRRTALNVIVAIAGALLGGWACVYFLGNSENMQILSLVTALAVAGLFLWILSFVTPADTDDIDDV